MTYLQALLLQLVAILAHSESDGEVSLVDEFQGQRGKLGVLILDTLKRLITHQVKFFG